ncbi:MAG: hypothetical protein CVV27_19570 [Candidatus Melainabacteria bacterium HGW-Melainabacteria-1]|nr:MAG: hypothetical protein CVV27_19570 [Candidatus Melainabacteria bacterium HGW-Melainabacteria-1]
MNSTLPSAHTLLAIDDDVSMLSLVRLLLEPQLARVWTSEDPHEGLRLAIIHKPSLILLDNHMRDMNGIEVLHQLRKMPATREIPVIMLTGDNSLATVQTAAREQVAGYLLKPCDPQDLLAVIAPLLNLAVPPPHHELTRPLKLSPEQDCLLEMHSILNVLGVLSNELNILVLTARELDHLKPSLEKLKLFKSALTDPVRRWEILAEVDDLEQLVLSNFEALQQARPELADLLPLEAWRDNLASIFAVFRIRAHELMARAADPLIWQTLPIEQVRSNLIHVFEAIERNSHGRYHIVYKALDKYSQDYLVEVEVISSRGEQIHIPLVLQDVMRDLSANARKYTEPGGCIRSRLVEDGEALRLTVSDTGRGIPPDELEAVVEFGSRGSNTGDTPAWGAGFGLTKAYAITRRLGGKMWIASKVGEGTTITLEIPLHVASDIQ